MNAWMWLSIAGIVIGLLMVFGAFIHDRHYGESEHYGPIVAIVVGVILCGISVGSFLTWLVTWWVMYG